MKLPLLAIAAIAGAFGICDLCRSSALAQPSAVAMTTRALAPAARIDTVVLHVEGMTCGGCTIATKRVLERLDGVSKADVSYEQKRAVVTYDPAKITIAQMIAAVATLKYTATVVQPAAKL